MKTSREKPVLIFSFLIKEDKGTYIAHCLELDILTTGTTLEQAEQDIMDLVIAQVDYAFSNDNLDHLYHPAPQEVWREFFACRESRQTKHKVTRKFQESSKPKSFVPPWIIAQTCKATVSCHA